MLTGMDDGNLAASRPHGPVKHVRHVDPIPEIPRLRSGKRHGAEEIGSNHRMPLTLLQCGCKAVRKAERGSR